MVALNNGEAAIIGDSVGAVLWLFFGKNVTEHGPWHYDREATPYQNTRLGKRNPRQHYDTLWKEARSSLQCETRGRLDETILGKRNPLTTLELGEAILHEHTMKGKRNPLTTPELGEAILHDNTRNPERIEWQIEWMSKQSLCQILIDLCTDRPSWQSLQKRKTTNSESNESNDK